ncbi:MAG TPA: DUF5723 family protein [Bacteroidota bacterium]|nr:DUF5723 family protein [Bacteroidota bacterium]
MKQFVIAAVLLVAGTTAAVAQSDGYSARTIGMARTFTASSRGFDALGLNPANLAFSDPSTTVSFTLVPPVGVRLSSDFFSLDLYNTYFTGEDSLDANGKPTGTRIGKKLTQADKDAILGRMENGLSHTDLNVNAMLFGLVVNAGSFGIGVSVSDHVGLSLTVPDTYLKFAFNGIDTAGSQYNFGQTAVRSLWYREYNVSAGVLLPIETKSIRNVSAGVGVKVIQGFNYISTARNNSRLVTTALSDSMSITAVSDLEALYGGIPLDSTAGDNILKPGGRGMGFDIGVSAEVFSGIRVAASMLNIGSITWSGNTKRIVNQGSYSWRASKYDQAELDRVKDDIDSVFTSKKTDGGEFSTKLPTSLHAGASIEMQKFVNGFPVPLQLAADVHFGLNDEPGNFSSTLLGLGAELDLLNGWIPLRTGVLIGGNDKLLWSAGIGFHFWNSFDLDVATESMSILARPNSFRTGSVILAMKVRI